MRASHSTSTPKIRRRIPSLQHEVQYELDSNSIRVVPTEQSLIHSARPCNPERARSYRKAVPFFSEGKEKGEEVAVIRAGNILMEQVARQADGVACETYQNLLPPTSIFERAPSVSLEKTKYSDQPFDKDGEIDAEDFCNGGSTRSKLHEDTIDYDYQPASSFGIVAPHLDFPAPSCGTLVPPPLALPQEQKQACREDLLSSTSAASTLASVGHSLQWTQKFPQGRHLTRAKSRTTLRRKDTVPGRTLTEARAGLRLLAKRREDIQEEEEADSTRLGKWNPFKWILFMSVLVVFLYGSVALIFALLTWAEAWDGAEVSVLVDTDLIILLSVASSLCLLSSMVGLSGTILNSRPILALYAFVLWPSLLSLLTVGYISYKRNNLRLDLKLNQTWSRYMDDLSRLRVQEILRCCGYYSPLHQATFSRYCYPRTTLPGCKGPLYRAEKRTLPLLYTAVFSVVFLHLAAIAVSLLCSNHVNVTFGKGLTPRAYRLDVSHVRRNAVNIIRILSSGDSEKKDVHHLLQVDEAMASKEIRESSLLSRSSLERWKG
ncbi:hypothetical protein CBS101457_004512 [Exobasidium rhododendri]|nr:hypothetical protein CBS101457_004512 [Exobasidium rhododendri]